MQTAMAMVYATFVIKVFAQTIIRWRVSTSMTTSFALDAVNRAIFSRDPVQGDLIHRSDRGKQCMSIRFAEPLAEAGASHIFWLGSYGAALLPIVDFGLTVVFEAAFYGEQGIGIGFQPAASRLTKKYGMHPAEAGIDMPVGNVEGSYNNPLAEAVIGRFITETVKPIGPWKTIGQVEWETLKWVHRYNKERQNGATGYQTPSEKEDGFYQQQHKLEKAAQVLNKDSRSNT